MPGRPRAPRLMLVTDPDRTRLPLLDLAGEAVAGGVDAIYLRGGADDEGIAPTPELARELRARVGEEVALLVNRRPGVAPTAGAGLHLRERDPIPAEARGMRAATTLIGRSVHSPEEAAASVGMDYLLAGHVYPSPSKPGLPPLGLAGFAAIAAAAPCPVLAIGGITAERVADVVRAGALGAAVIGAIVEADDPRAAASALRAALDQAMQEHVTETHMQQDTTTTTVEIVVNGKPVTVPAGSSIHDFLASKRMTDAMAIVERNGEIVPRTDYPTVSLLPGDRLEIVHAVGGG